MKTQFIWTVIIGAICGAIIDKYGSGPSIINFCVFLAIWSVLALILVLHTNAEGCSEPLVVAFEALTLLFWICGASALTAQVNYSWGWAPTGPSSRRLEAQAICCFLWLGVLSFGISLSVSLGNLCRC